MKKSLLIVISFVAVFIIASTSQAQTYSFDVTWNDSECSCGAIVLKELGWEIRRVADNSLFEKGGPIDITLETPPYTVDGYEEVEVDTQYYICAKVYYYDASLEPLCCKGQGCIRTDSASLESGDQVVPVVLE